MEYIMVLLFGLMCFSLGSAATWAFVGHWMRSPFVEERNTSQWLETYKE